MPQQQQPWQVGFRIGTRQPIYLTGYIADPTLARPNRFLVELEARVQASAEPSMWTRCNTEAVAAGANACRSRLGAMAGALGVAVVRLGLVVPSPALAQEGTSAQALEQRLQRLEARVDSLQHSNASLRRDLGIDGRAGQIVVKPSGKEPVFQAGGLLQVQADFGDQVDTRLASHDRFYLRRTRLNATGRFLEDFDFKVEAELSGVLGETPGLRAQVTDGYFNWTRYSRSSTRVGQFKTPFGYEQLALDPRLYTIERSLANDRLTLSRQVGMQLSGQFLERRLGYSLGVFNGNGVNVSFNDNDNFS